MSYKTTKKHFDYFKKCCLKYTVEFGLGEWQLFFDHGSCFGNDCDDFASINFADNNFDKIVTLSLSNDWGDVAPINRRIDFAAYHEVAHIVLFPMVCCLLEYYSDKMVQSLWHEAIRRMEKSKFGNELAVGFCDG